MRLGPIDNFLLLGGGQLLLEAARLLRSAGREATVVTSPRHAQERIPGEGGTLAARLSDERIPYLIVERIEHTAVEKRIGPRTLGLSLGAAWIFRQAWIDRFEGRLLNLHGARLPQDRGAGGFSWQILRANRLGCCLVHQVTPGLDDGPIVDYEEFVFPSTCRIPRDYQDVYIHQNLAFLRRLFDRLAEGRDFSIVGQPDYLSLYWPRLSTMDHGWIDWTWTRDELERFICAFDEPYAGASTMLGTTRLHLKNCFVDASDGGFHPFQTGLVYRRTNAGLFVATKGGSLVIGRVETSQGQNVTGRIQLGDRLHTPQEQLDAARDFRAVYTPSQLKSATRRLAA